MAVYLGQVISVSDNKDADRIKVRIPSADKTKGKDKERYAFSFPLLPKTFHVKPKIGEYVLILCEDDENKNSQRYYIGPLISQPQLMQGDLGNFAGTSALNESTGNLGVAPSTDPNSKGALAENDDIAVYGRKNSEAIFSDDSAEIRCGVRLANGEQVVFNRNGSFLKLGYNSDGVDFTSGKGEKRTAKSTATLVADDINLISNNGNPNILSSKKENNGELITDDELKQLLEKTHLLPYGDVLVDVLMKFFQMFKEHTHNYTNLPPVHDETFNAYEQKYGNQSALTNKLLSEHIRIN